MANLNDTITDGSAKFKVVKSATTDYVSKNAHRLGRSNITIYVSNASGTNGDGSSVSSPMSLGDLDTYLSTITMVSDGRVNSLNNSWGVIIKFIPTGKSYGNVTFDNNKMPGIRHLTVDTSTGINTTLSNYTTNAAFFDKIHVVGGHLEVTLRNVEVLGEIVAFYNSTILINTYVGCTRILSLNYGRVDIQAGIINLHNDNLGAPFLTQEFGQIVFDTATVTINFRDQCYYYSGIFRADLAGRIHIRYPYLKFTGIKPVVAWGMTNVTLTATSSTNSNVAAKTATLESGQTFTLTANAVAYVKFTNNNTASNPTLNINNTGAKQIVLQNYEAIPANYLQKNIIYKFVYYNDKYICPNQFNFVENFAGNATAAIIGEPSITYNNSEWNFAGYQKIYYAGCVINGTLFGNVDGVATKATQDAGGNTITSTYAKVPNWIDSSLSHNSICRGKNLTSYFDSGEMSTAIANASFKDIFVGDYIVKTINLPALTYTDKSGENITLQAKTMENVKWLVVGIDCYRFSGINTFNTHHLVMMSNVGLEMQLMNPTDTTEGGYVGSDMWNVHMQQRYADAVKNAFGTSHVLVHDEWLSNSFNTNTNSTSAAYWEHVTVNIPNEAMLWGKTSCSTNYLDNCQLDSQLPYFRNAVHIRNEGGPACWTRSIAANGKFVAHHNGGHSVPASATMEDYYIRPYFLLY